MDDREAAARVVCATLAGAGHRALLAGGCVRDRLLGVAPKDFDVATGAAPAQVIAIFPRTAPVGLAFGSVLVLTDAGPVEVTTFRTDGPYLDGRRPSAIAPADERGDALRRDFTINALFLDPSTDAVIDHVGGRADLDAGVVRTVGAPEDRFAEDYLRMLRAVRFAARLDFTLDPAARAAIRTLAPKIRTISAERVRDELLKMLTEGGAHRAFRLLDETGLLAEVLPEIAAMKGVEQPPEYHPEGDVFTHTLLLLEHLNHPSPTLALGALLHDVGKPRTQTFTDRIRFNNHDKVGADMARGICGRLRLSNDQTERVVWLVEQHMRFGALPDMNENKRLRFIREPGFDELAALHRLDCKASHRDEDIADWVDAYRANLPPGATRPEPLLRGADLIALGYPPGPRFREILTTLEDAQLNGEITDRDAALGLIRAKFPRAD